MALPVDVSAGRIQLYLVHEIRNAGGNVGPLIRAAAGSF